MLVILDEPRVLVDSNQLTSHRGRSVLALLIVMVFALCACGEQTIDGASVTETATPPTTAGSLQTSPTVRRIADIVGSDVGELYAAVDEARFDFIVGCMRKDGWDFDRSMLPSSYEPMEASSDLLGTSAANAISMIETLEGSQGDPAPDAEGTQDTVPPRPQRARDESGAVSACFDQALAEVPNPLEPLQSWLEHEQSYLEDYVRTDRRVADALAAQDRCFRESGYDFRDVGDANDYVAAKATPILEGYGSGELDASEAIEMLQPIAKEGGEIAAVLGPCLTARLAVEFAVRSEYELEWLQKNSDRVAFAAEELLGDLEQIRGFIRDRP